MVYLRDVIDKNMAILSQNNNIELVAYFYVSSPERLRNTIFSLTPEEEISFKGYKSEEVDNSDITAILRKPSVKGIDAFSNVFKFAGLYLAARNKLWKNLLSKYNQSDIKYKYFIAKIEPMLMDNLKKDICNSNELYSTLIKVTLGFNDIGANDLDSALYSIIANKIDLIDIILLEDIEKSMLKLRYINKSSEDIIRDILNNFANSVQRITKDRRKGHSVYSINDEYDLQDILYVIFKSVFPNMKDEDPIPKIGGKSTKIDFIFRENNILLEVKMIKETDINELKFIDQLKIDFESYHQCQWLNKLFCFVYDPYKRTQDVSNFYELNGERRKDRHIFTIEVILSN
jgi:hypothetical protein